MLRAKLCGSHTSLSDEIRLKIIDIIYNGSDTECQLPPENAMAEQFGVSINVIREALILLREQGIITKKHGLGNFYHKSAICAAKRLDLILDFDAYLSESGYTPSRLPCVIQECPANDTVAAGLHLPVGTPVYYYETMHFADLQPAMVCHSWFPHALFCKSMLGMEISIPYFDIFPKFCRKEVTYGNMELLPRVADNALAQVFGIDDGAAYITMTGTFYTYRNEPLAFCEDCLNPRIVTANIFYA